MAKVKPNSMFSLTGTLDGICIYRMEGVEGLIARRKGGATREKIRNHPAFANTRRNNTELGGRSATAAAIAAMFAPLKPFGGYLQSGKLGALLLGIQKLDTGSEWGKRHVLLSRNPRLLEGFNLNARRPFEAVIHTQPRASLDRAGMSAIVQLPSLIPGLNFSPTGNHAYFRVVAALGLVPDYFYASPQYRPAGGYGQLFPVLAETGWLMTKAGMEAKTLQLNLPIDTTDENFSLILTVGVQLGSPGPGGNITGVRYSGGSRILAMG